MIITLFLISCLFSLIAYLYLKNFVANLAHQFLTDYVFLFNESASHSVKQIKLPPFSKLQLRSVFILFPLFLIFPYFQGCVYYSVWLGSILCIGWIILLIDFQYQIIPLYLSLAMMTLAVLGSWLKFSGLDLDTVFTSMLIAFSSGTFFYYVVKWIYKKEMLGQGDYWLFTGLAGFCSPSELTLLILISSVLGILWILPKMIRTQNPHITLAFAPCLLQATLIIRLITLQ